MISWLRKLIPHCSIITKDLRAQTNDNKPNKVVWTAKLEQDFAQLKSILMSNIVLAHPDFTKPFYIHVDASAAGIGAILTQIDEKGQHRVIEYASVKLTDVESRYSNAIREGLGIVWSLNHFKYYVYGHEPMVYCDCHAISDIFKRNAQNIPEHIKLCDWAARIMQYNVKMMHKPGKLMAIPDALSRCHIVQYAMDQDYEVLNF
jgi:hypothetical protein